MISAGDDAEPRGGEGGGAEERRRDRVLDRRRARECRHGEGERAERDRTRDQPLGHAGVAEQRHRDREHGEGHDEQRDAAIGQDGAGEDHGQDRPLLANPLDDPVGDHLALPLSSMSLPKMAPSMNSGKNWATYLPSELMKICV